MGKRVLVLDDDPDVLEIIESILTFEEFEVTALSKTENIFQTIADHQPDVILLDFVLGGADGGDLCRQIKSNTETQLIPVVIISAYQGNMGAFKEVGCDRFIPKPFSLNELVEGINITLDNKAFS